MRTFVKKNFYIYFLLLYSILTKLFNSLASPIFAENCFQADNNVFYAVGKSILCGRVLYKDMVDNKGPYTFFINMLANLLPYRHIGLYIIESLLLFLSLYFVYKIVKIYIDSDKYAILVSCLFSIMLNNSYITQGMSRTECYTMPFVLVACYYLLRFLRNEHDDSERIFTERVILLIGISLGVTLLINIKHIIMIIIFCAFAIVKLLLNKNFKCVFRFFIYGALGLIIATLPFIIYAIFTDSVNDAIYCMFILPFKYVGKGISLFYDSDGLLDSVYYHFINHISFFVFIFISLILVIVCEKNIYIILATTISFLAIFCCLSLANAPYVHYLVTYLPFTIGIYMCVVYTLRRILCDKSNRFKNAIICVGICLDFIFTLLIGYRDVSKQYPAMLQCNSRIRDSVIKICDDTENAKILAVGYIPEVYIALDNVISFSHFITMNNTYKGAKEFVDAQCDYVENGESDIVVVNTRDSFMSFSEEKMDMLNKNLQENYLAFEMVKSGTTNGNYIIYKRVNK